MKTQYLIYAIAVVMIGFLILNKVNDRIISNMHFQGVVEKVEYSENKGTPTVTVNNVAIFLSTNIDFKRQIEVGDTISKKKGEDVFKITKKSSGKLYIFKTNNSDKLRVCSYRYYFKVFSTQALISFIRLFFTL